MKKGVLLKMLRGILIGLLICAVLICVLALILKGVDLHQSAISGICIVIKLLSVFFACLIAVSSAKKKHGLLGGITATAFWIVCYVLLAIFNGFTFDVLLLLDYCLTVLAGVLCSLIVKALSR